MVLVPGASFEMGSPPVEPSRRSDERRHPVALSPFLIMRTPVTRATWRVVMDEAPPGQGDERHAVEVRDWSRANDFCVRAGLALPTEAQWEHACRAGSSGSFAWGADASLAGRHAHLGGGWGAPARPVGDRAPNAFGLFDVHGCVWEWCADRYGEYPFSEVLDPRGGESGDYRVLRGGSRFDAPHLARAAYRCAALPGVGVAPAGLRAVAPLHADDALDPVESSVAGVEMDDA
jgi:formylglycine-generating enzyme required for sulfatase activity